MDDTFQNGECAQPACEIVCGFCCIRQAGPDMLLHDLSPALNMKSSRVKASADDMMYPLMWGCKLDSLLVPPLFAQQC